MGEIVLPKGTYTTLPFGKFLYCPQAERIARMQTVHETRRDRLNLLLKKYRTHAELNEALGWVRTDSKLSRIKNANTRSDRDGKVFQMGDAIAREIEQKLQLAEGWMDTPLSYAELHNEEDPRALVMSLMEALPASEWSTVVRLVDALAQPDPKAANGQ